MRFARRAAAGPVNLRDVGGLPAADGRRVRAGRLFRGDAPIRGDRAPDLLPWPPRTVVDLRSPEEASGEDHPLAGARTRVLNIPLFREIAPGRMTRRRGRAIGDLPSIYRDLLRASGPGLVRVVDVIASSPAPLLLHCAAGKDRTGVATAVTLAAVGVRPEAIVADYLRTEECGDHLLHRLALGWPEAVRETSLHHLTVVRPDLMRTPAAAIEAVLDTLHDAPGGPAGWLLARGLEVEALQALDRDLLEPPGA